MKLVKRIRYTCVCLLSQSHLQLNRPIPTDGNILDLEHPLTECRGDFTRDLQTNTSSICTARIAASCCRLTSLTASNSVLLASTSVSSNALPFRASHLMLFDVETRSVSISTFTRFSSFFATSSFLFNARLSDYFTSITFRFFFDSRLGFASRLRRRAHLWRLESRHR